MKYKSCCSTRCLVHGCSIRENGGCYCVCRLHDHVNDLKSFLDGRTLFISGGTVYIPDDERRKKSWEHLSEKEKEEHLDFMKKVPDMLVQAKQKLKEYEV
jgi:hypothetical protein